MHGVLPGVPIGGALGDQQAALVRADLLRARRGQVHVRHRRFLLMNTGTSPSVPTHGLLTDRRLPVRRRAGLRPGGLDRRHRLAGAVVPRLARHDPHRAPRSRPWPRTVADNGGCYIVPAFSGLFAPHWRPDARGVIVGLTSYITKGHLARAVLEATGWQTREVVDAMNADSACPSDGAEGRRRHDGQQPAHAVRRRCARRAGGAPHGRPRRSRSAPPTPRGSPSATGRTSRCCARNWHRAAVWEPAMDPALRDRERENWGRAVDRSYGWAGPTERPRDGRRPR